MSDNVADCGGVSSRIPGFTLWRPVPYALLLVLALAAIVRISLTGYSLWVDELASVFFAGRPMSDLWSNWMLRETNPPLYYSVLKGWIWLVGMSEVKLRLLSIIGSLAAIITAYVGVGANYGRRAGVTAALLLTASAQQLFFSHMVRNYIFLYLAISISFYALASITRSQGKTDRELSWTWFAYVVGSATAIYLHTTAVIWPLVATGAMLLADRRFRNLADRRWLSLLAANLLILAIASWWLYVTYLQTIAPNGNINWIVSRGLYETAWTFFLTVLLSREAYGLEKVVPLTVAGLCLLGVLRTWHLPATRLALFCSILAVLAFMSINIKQPIILDRTVFWISIFTVTLAAAGLGTIRDRRVFIVAVAAMILLLGYNFVKVAGTLQHETWQISVRQLARDTKAVLVTNDEGMNIAAKMACVVELQRLDCPFPIMTIQSRDDHQNLWAKGLSERVPTQADGRPAFRTSYNAYLIRRGKDDLFLDKATDAVFISNSRTLPNLAGPFPPPFIENLAANAPIEDGVMRARTR